MNPIEKIKYLNELKKETNDTKFINKVNRIKNQIEIYNPQKEDYEKKIQQHYQIIQKMFLNKKSNDIRYLETKKMAYNYHLYLLENYYNEIQKTLFLEKLSN